MRIDANRRVDESEADHESCSDDEELPNGLPTKTSPGGSRLTVSDSLRRRSGRLRKKNDEESEDECSSSTTSSSGDEPNCKFQILTVFLDLKRDLLHFKSFVLSKIEVGDQTEKDDLCRG